MPNQTILLCLDVDVQCSSCADTIHACMKDISITSYHLDMAKKKLTIYKSSDQHHTALKDDYQAIKKALTDYGIGVPLQKRPILWKNILQGLIGLISGIGIMGFMFSGVPIPFVVLHTIAGLSVLLTLVLGQNSIQRALKQLFKTKRVSMDTLLVISAITTLSISLAAFVVPGLPMMFGDPLILFGLHHIGIVIQKLCGKRIMKPLSFAQRAPKKVIQISNDKPIESDTAALKIGDIIQLEPGQYLPVDALCLSSEGLIDTQLHDGSLTPSPIIINSNYKAGIKVTGHQAIRFNVLKPVTESTLNRLDEQLAITSQEKSNLEQYTDRMLQWFIPMVIVFAATFGSLNFLYLHSTVLAISTTLSVLTAACPCVLSLLSTGTLTLGLWIAREHGVAFKSTKDLEEAAGIDTIVFDLNGTLTEGKPSVSSCDFLKGSDEAQLKNVMSTLEKKSNHRFADAIKTYCNSPAELDIANSQTVYNGVLGTIQEKTYLLGNSALMEQHNLSLPEEGTFPPIKQDGQLLYLAADQQIVARIQIRDRIRPDALSLIHQLKKDHKLIYICTGASQETALSYGKQLGIEPLFIKSNQNTEHKKDFIQSLQASAKRVAMVGDAGNDSLPIAQANLGIAMQSGDPLTCSVADVIVNDHHLQPILTTLILSKMTISKINRILIINLIYNLAMMGIIGLVLPNVGIAVPAGLGLLVMFGESMLLTAYSLQLTQVKPPSLNIPQQTMPLGSTFEIQQGLCQSEISIQTKAQIKTASEKTHPRFFQAVPVAEKSTIMTPQPETNEWIKTSCVING